MQSRFKFNEFILELVRLIINSLLYGIRSLFLISLSLIDKTLIQSTKVYGTISNSEVLFPKEEIKSTILMKFANRDKEFQL